MENISMWSGGVPSKSNLKSYVHDAAELEFSLFALQEGRKELQKKLEAAKRENPTRNVRVPQYEAEIKPSKTLLPYRTVTPEDERKIVARNRQENPLDYWGQDQYLKGFSFRQAFISSIFAWIGIIISWCIAVLIFGVAWVTGAGEEVFAIIAGLIGLVGSVASFIIADKLAKKKQKDHNAAVDARVIAQYHKEVQEYNDDIKRQNDAEERRYQDQYRLSIEENPRIRERNAQKRRKYEEDCAKVRVPYDRKIAILEAQCSELDAAIQRMEQDRERFYSVNIVPVDYRTIQCVFYLDHAFRNDLVDTVRQGIDRFELSEYRNAVLGGISIVISKLDQVTGLMHDLGVRLKSIQAEVSIMSNDIYTIADRQSREQAEMGNRLLEESRLRRKVAEELNENAERIARYCESR